MMTAALKAYLTVLATILCLSVIPALADQEDERLDPLFDLLHSTQQNSDEAFLAQQNIWTLWLEAPSSGAQILMSQGVIQMQEHAFIEALVTFSALVALEPDYAEAWNKRATVFFLSGHLEESLADIDKAMELEPRHFGAQSGRGMVLSAMNEPAAAVQAFEKALEINPHMPQVTLRIEQLKAELERTQL